MHGAAHQAGLELRLHHRGADHADSCHAGQGQGQDTVRRQQSRQGAFFLSFL